MRTIVLLPLCAALLTVVPSAYGQVNSGPYTPEQVYSVMHDEVRHLLGIPEATSGEDYLSLSIVGTVAEQSDQVHIDDLANWCPQPAPVITSFASVPTLDAVYEDVVNKSVSPKREFSEEYAKAKAIVYTPNGDPSPHYAKYIEYRDKVRKEKRNYATAKEAIDRAQALDRINDLNKEWSAAGYRGEIDMAMTSMMSEEYIVGASRTLTRLDRLASYRVLGLPSPDAPGGYVSPLSSLSPSPSSWSAPNGWVKVSLSSEDVHSRYSAESSQSHGFGGLSIGFVTIVGQGGGGNGSESRVKEVYKLSYEFQILRVQINRPWLDTSLFLQPNGWTWRKVSNTKDFPYVAVDASPTGVPLAPVPNKYDNAKIACPLLAKELIVAKDREIIATVSKSDYKVITDSGSSSGGGSFFGIFGGGGGHSWSSTKISEDDKTVTFKVQAPGTAVIGVISQVLKRVPNPNTADTWPAEAWMPTP